MPVTLFFILSGYLFWSRALRDRGMLSYKKFFSARFRRILPAFYSLFFALTAYVLIRSRFVLNESTASLLGEVATWLTVGVPVDFKPLNHIGEMMIACAGVVWTLRYEMMFYLAMPFLALFATKRKTLFIVIVFFVLEANLSALASKFGSHVIRFFADFVHYFALGFGFGFIAALIEQTIGESTRSLLRKSYFSFLGILVLVIAFLLPIQAYSYGASILLTAFFVLVVARNDFFGVLTLRGSQLLGKLSYTIYLFHGFVLHLVSLFIDSRIKPFAELSAPEFWLYVGACGIMTLVLSAAVHYWIEIPFLSRKSVPKARTGLNSAQPI